MDKEKVLLEISEADDDFIEDILTVAMKRKQQLYPDWEIRYLAVPGEAAGQQRQRYERAWQVLAERRAGL